TALDTALTSLQVLRDNAAQTGATLIALTTFQATVNSVDQKPFDLAPFRQSVLGLARDLLQKATFLRNDINRRVANATGALARAAAAAGSKAQTAVEEAARAMLGEESVVLPEFRLQTNRLAD